MKFHCYKRRILDSGFWILDSQSAFTLIELLIAVGIFTVVIVAFITMFVAVTKVQVQQSSAAEVNAQSQFVLQELQYYIGHASFIDMPTSTPTTTLKLWMGVSSTDPTLITLSGGALYLQQAGGALQPLTSNKVAVSNLSFTKRSNAPSHDSVDIAFTLAYNTSNLTQAFSEMLQTSVARVSAASFDSNLVPNSSSSLSVGMSGATWSSINNIINFNGSNVGINVANPTQMLSVNGSAVLGGGLQLFTANGTSTVGCSASTRGFLWYVQEPAGATDTLQLCVRGTGAVYQWVKLY